MLAINMMIKLYLIAKQNTTGGGSAVSKEKRCNLFCRGTHDENRRSATATG